MQRISTIIRVSEAPPYFFSIACQFSTMVIGMHADCSTGVVIQAASGDTPMGAGYELSLTED